MNGKIRLLYIEDNPADAHLTKTHFAKEAPEFEIDIAATGEECFELLQKNTYDALMLDYPLPDMDGLDVLRKLVQKGSLLPVVMVTGMGDEEAAAAAIKLGAFDYVVKRENYLARLVYSIGT